MESSTAARCATMATRSTATGAPATTEPSTGEHAIPSIIMIAVSACSSSPRRSTRRGYRRRHDRGQRNEQRREERRCDLRRRDVKRAEDDVDARARRTLAVPTARRRERSDHRSAKRQRLAGRAESVRHRSPRERRDDAEHDERLASPREWRARDLLRRRGLTRKTSGRAPPTTRRSIRIRRLPAPERTTVGPASSGST